MDEWEIPQQLNEERVDRTVALLSGLPRTRVVAGIERGLVQLNGEVVEKPSLHLSEGDTVVADFDDLMAPVEIIADPSVPYEVVYKDDDVLVVNKPSDVVVHPGAGTKTGTLVHGLLAQFPELRTVGETDRPGIVHRIDKGTSGLLMVACNEAARLNLIQQLVERTVERRYLTLVWGLVEEDEGLIDAPIGRSDRNPLTFTVNQDGKEARTRYIVLNRFTDPGELTYMECKLESGRTHQIRVHCKAIGHPVVGDAQYRGVRGTLMIPRPFLHAATLGFKHPRTNEPVRFIAPLPADLAGTLSTLS